MDSLQLNDHLSKMIGENNTLGYNGPDCKTTGLTLCAMAELASGIISEVIGNEVSSQLSGSPLTRAVIEEIIIGDVTNRILEAKRNGVAL